MKRLPLLGLIFALASCGTSLNSSEQAIACYDTGSGMKCVQLADLPDNVEAVCIDTDGDTTTSQSSASGPSADDNDTSASSDSPDAPLREGGIATTDADDSVEDASGDSDSAEDPGCGGNGADADGDGTSDSTDCDCVDPDDPGPIL